jgi:uncharacterized protein
MLARLILLILIVVIVMMVSRRFKVAASAPRKRATIEATTVRCAHCQVYLPSNEAISRGGQHYCSAAHADQARHRS